MTPAMNTQNEDTGRTWSVLVIDMFHYMDPEDGEQTVEGFLRTEDAIEYARRRMRSSLEACRPSAADAADLKNRWFMFGEDCIAIGTDYMAFSEIDDFIAHPATPEDIDWVSLEPDPNTRALLLDVSRSDQGEEAP
jgi:hypothetical protein